LRLRLCVPPAFPFPPPRESLSEPNIRHSCRAKFILFLFSLASPVRFALPPLLPPLLGPYTPQLLRRLACRNRRSPFQPREHVFIWCECFWYLFLAFSWHFPPSFPPLILFSLRRTIISLLGSDLLTFPTPVNPPFPKGFVPVPRLSHRPPILSFLSSFFFFLVSLSRESDLRSTLSFFFSFSALNWTFFPRRPSSLSFSPHFRSWAFQFFSPFYLLSRPPKSIFDPPSAPLHKSFSNYRYHQNV